MSDSTDTGLGDTIAKAIKAVTRGRVKPCKGCERRRKALNKAVPYRRRKPCSNCGDGAAAQSSDDRPKAEAGNA
jgi:hypothetical protein